MIKWIKEKVTKTWQKIKDWSGWSHAGDIFLARMLALSGIITSMIGVMDWSPLWALFTSGTEFTTRQLIFMGIGMLGSAITAEITSRMKS